MDLRGAESRALGNLVSVPQPLDRLASVSVCPLGPGILQLVGLAFYEIKGPVFHSASGHPSPYIIIFPRICGVALIASLIEKKVFSLLSHGELASSNEKKFLLGEDSGKSLSCGTRSEVL